jgi:hypothetical protein
MGGGMRQRKKNSNRNRRRLDDILTVSQILEDIERSTEVVSEMLLDEMPSNQPHRYASADLDDEGVEQISPMSTYQFMFGNDLLVAPVRYAANLRNDTMSALDLWVPPGLWVECHSGATFRGAKGSGSRYEKMRFHLNEVPIYARAGSIIPTIPLFDGSVASAQRGDSGGSTVGTAQRQYDHLVFTLHLSTAAAPSGGDNTADRIYEQDGSGRRPTVVVELDGTPEPRSASTRVYEDDGRSTAYVDSARKPYAWTSAAYTWTTASHLQFKVSTRGRFAELPANRAYTLRIRNAAPSMWVKVAGSGVTLPTCGVLGYMGAAAYPLGCVHYDGTEVSLAITVPDVNTVKGLQLEIEFGTFAGAFTSMVGLRGAIEHARLAKSTLDEARANPAGQCCEWPNDQPLKRLAAFGDRLESSARDSSDGAAGRFCALARSGRQLVMDAASEIKVIYEAPAVALRVLRFIGSGVPQARGTTAAIIEKEDSIRNTAIVKMQSNGVKLNKLKRMSNIEMAIEFGVKHLTSREQDFTEQMILMALYEMGRPNVAEKPNLKDARNIAIDHVVREKNVQLRQVQALSNFQLARKYGAKVLAKKRLSVVQQDISRRTEQGRLTHAYALLETSVERL